MKFQESNCSDLVLHDSSFINRDLSSEGKKKRGEGEKNVVYFGRVAEVLKRSFEEINAVHKYRAQLLS